MNRMICVFMAFCLLFLSACTAVNANTARPGMLPPPENLTAGQDGEPPTAEEISLILKRGDHLGIDGALYRDPFEVQLFTGEETTEATTTETTAPETTVPETTVPETLPPETNPPETDPPVTEPPPPPMDYSTLSEMYGYPVDNRFDRTWSEMAAGGQAIDPAKPMVALTFDDGPSRHTERLLDIFAANGGKGTFFVIGNAIGGREHILARMSAEGHEIGGHSWWHSDLRTLSERALADEIMMTRQRIFAATGEDSYIVRPPYGANNEFVRWVGGQCGVAFVNWSVDTLDWKTRNADAIFSAVVNGAYDGAVILCHDLHGSTVDAMERAIPALIEMGYQLVTVSELMMHSANAFEAGRMYNKK